MATWQISRPERPANQIFALHCRFCFVLVGESHDEREEEGVNLPGSLRIAFSRQTGDVVGQFTWLPVSGPSQRPHCLTALTTAIRTEGPVDQRVEVCDRDAGLASRRSHGATEHFFIGSLQNPEVDFIRPM
jgi:hypothetical protein